MIIILTILAELAFIAILILFLYRLKFLFGLAPLYMLIGANQLFQTLLSTRVDLEILGGLSIYISPSIIFSAGLFTILLIYIKEGVQTTQRFIFSIILANLSLTILSSISNWQEIAMTDKASILFYPNFRVLAAGIISLILDAFILVILYEFFFSKVKWLNLFSRLALTLLIILNFDSLLFVTISFWEKPDFSSKLISHMFGKSIAALFFATVLWLYLRFLDKGRENDNESSENNGNEDIFSILTYKGKFEKLVSEKAISDEELQKIIAEKTKEQEKSIRRFTILSTIKELKIDLFSASEQAKEFLVKIKDAFEVDACAILLAEGEELQMFSSVGIEENNKKFILRFGMSYLKKMTWEKQNFFLEDTGTKLRFFDELPNDNTEFKYISCAGTALIMNDKKIGLLKLYSVHNKRSFSQLEIEHLLLVANQIVHSIETGQLFEQNEKQKEILVKQIMARKKAEAAIKESEEKYRSLVEQASDGIIQFDEQGRIMFVNTTFCRMVGYTEEEFLKMKVEDTYAETEKPLARQRLIEVGDKGSISFERMMIKKNGMGFPVEVSIKKVKDGQLLGIVRDITERKKAEENLRISNEAINNIIENSPSLIYLFDVEGKFMLGNKNFEKLLDFPFSAFVGKTRESFFSKEISDTHRNNDLIVIQSKKVLMLEEENIEKDGKHYYITAKFPLFDLNGNVYAVGGISTDITNRKKTEETIKETNEQLRLLSAHLQTIREEERKRIAREIHDELGQQLTAIKMDVAWIDKKTPDKDELIQNKFKNIIELLDGSNQSIRKILSELRQSFLDDNGLLETMQWQGSQFTQSTGIPVQFSSSETVIRLPEEIAICIFRVYQESLTNIAKYADASEVVISLNMQKDNIILSVEDNGKGFVETMIKTKKSFGLLGMKERVFALGGKFELISSPGKGTKIEISLPYKT